MNCRSSDHAAFKPFVVLLVTLSAASCRTTDRYIVTTTAIDAIDVSQLTLCFAVEPANPQGVWWWRPGRSGCSTRSSSLVKGDGAKVTALASGKVETSFQVPMANGETRLVELAWGTGTVRASATGISSGTEARKALDIPEKP
jgi:hypothetical protein